MNYNEALSFIHSRMKFGSRPGMERICALCEAFDNPQDKLKYVHVAGTNGKGSTCTMIAEMLKAAGYKVGLFTSPFVVDFRERIQINSEMIPKEDFAKIVEKVVPVVEELKSKSIEPTEFEIITAVAFLYFLQENCDIVVLEVGLGGTLDSTNIIKKSEVSVITSISMDHTDILGDTILDIAAHKCGIFKSGGHVVGYPQPDFAVERFVKEKAKEAGCDYTHSDLGRIRLVHEEFDGSTIIYAGCTFKIPLSGKHQIYNFSTAISAINVLKGKGWNVSVKNMLDGVAALKMPARVETVSTDPLVIVDGGHNAEGFDALCYTLEKYFKDKKIIAVFGMMKDKDYAYCAKKLAPLCEKIYTTTVSNPRSLTAKELAEELKKHGAKAKPVDDCGKAYKKALKKADKDSVVVVCGSLYLASDIKNLQN
ncbi:MAG: bifunctional folylpolyglutamate synthase/dihydrofolate synthase [Clostridia bacterium]|nr:bifunctional folylpolyglutamate synthase/dihydrofolate synthase [Clostridia bacterium]